MTRLQFRQVPRDQRRTAPHTIRLAARRMALFAPLMLLLSLMPTSAHAQERDSSGAYTDGRVVQLDRSDTTRSRVGLAIHVTTSDPLKATNTAVATTACDRCRAVAISFQIVVDGVIAHVDATNLAVADNSGCTDCTAVAIAYQFVVVLDHPVQLSRIGRSALRDVASTLRDLARSQEPVGQIRVQASAAARDVAAILASELHQRPEMRHYDSVKQP